MPSRFCESEVSSKTSDSGRHEMSPPPRRGQGACVWSGLGTAPPRSRLRAKRPAREPAEPGKQAEFFSSSPGSFPRPSHGLYWRNYSGTGDIPLPFPCLFGYSRFWLWGCSGRRTRFAAGSFFTYQAKRDRRGLTTGDPGYRQHYRSGSPARRRST